MAFENLTEKLQNVFKSLKSKGKLTEHDVKEAMRQVKLALLEADVSFKVVKDFVKSVTEKAVGSDVLESLTPGQQVIKIVSEELASLMGGENSTLSYSDKPPTIFILSGLQGAGKTTTAGKLAGSIRKRSKNPLLVACDVYRPAAVKQLQIVGKNYDIPVFAADGSKDPVDIAKKAVAYASENKYDTVIIDTAGRLHIDDDMMNELLDIKNAVSPKEILLVVDAMTGQDAVNVAEAFNSRLGIDGIILTKLDGDARGGAALSVRAVTGKPIKYVGMGEKMEDLEPFYPERMASRILGMGDVLSLIEKAQETFDMQKAAELEKKLRKQEFDLNDFLEQMRQIKKMGPLSQVLGMIPGMSNLKIDESQIDEKALSHTEAIIQSMTMAERSDPSILNGSRKKRISLGSGRPIQEVNMLVNQFGEMKKMMKMFGGASKGKRFKMPFLR